MPCNNRKDLSLCLAKTRVRVFDTRHFWDVYLWPDAQVAHDQAAREWDLGRGEFGIRQDPGPAAGAFCARNPYIRRRPRPGWFPIWLWQRRHWMPDFVMDHVGCWKDHWLPKLGEIHFAAKEGWDMETVAHECCHATITSARALDVNPRNVFTMDGSLSQHFADTPVMHSDAYPEWCVSSLSDEELFCYIHGMLFEKVYSWLWQVDAPAGTRRVSEWAL